MVQVTCINKDGGNHYNRHEGIANFGWANPESKERGNSSRHEMITWLEGGGYAFTRDVLGNTAKLVVRFNEGRKYVQTQADGRWTDNLLALSECRI